MTAWPSRPLRDLGRWYGGGTPSKSESSYWQGGTLPWLSPKDMGPECLSGTKDKITALAAAETAARSVPAPSVAVVVRSGILERRIPIALVPFETALNQDMKAVCAGADVTPEWIAWGLRAYERELLLTVRKAGTTVASLNVAALLDFKLPVPPMHEQRRTVEMLEEHLSSLEVARAEVDRSSGRVKHWSNSILRTLLASGDKARFQDIYDVAALPARNVEVRTASTTGRWPVVDQGDGLGVRSDVADAVFAGPLPVVVFGDHTRRIKLIHEEFAVGGSGIKVLTPQGGIDPEFAYWAARAAAVPSRGYGRHFAIFRAAVFRRGDSAFQQSVVATMRGVTEAENVMAAASRQVSERSAALRRALLNAAFSGQLTGSASDLDRAEEAIAS